MKTRLVPILAVIAALAATPATALADGVGDTVREIQRAVAVEPTAEPALDALTLDLPDLGSEDITLDPLADLELPAAGSGVTLDGTTVFDVAGSADAQVAVQSVPGGTRALVNIDSAQAPERFDFVVGGEVASLVKNEDGSVGAFDTAGNLVGAFGAPWARDAKGRSVSTHYEVSGTTLTQVVHHRGADVAYGVTADPIWLGPAIRLCMVTKCYRWWPKWIQNQFVNGEMNRAIESLLKAWFCKQTWIC